MKRYKTLFSIITLILLYGAGLFATIAGRDIIHFTPFLLLISALLLFASHSQLNTRFVAYALVVFVSGFIIQWTGVETGRVFGYYFYGNSLGYKLWDVPVIIGLNWLMLSYCSSVAVIRLVTKSPFIRSAFFTRTAAFIVPLIAAALMLLVDLFLEQAAPLYDFWYWKGQLVPFQNYTAWFAFAFAFNYLFYKLGIDPDNKVAPWLYCIQLLFVAMLALI